MTKKTTLNKFSTEDLVSELEKRGIEIKTWIKFEEEIKNEVIEIIDWRAKDDGFRDWLMDFHLVKLCEDVRNQYLPDHLEIEFLHDSVIKLYDEYKFVS